MDEDRTTNIAATLLCLVIVVAVLYFARVVFIPLALAVLLAFLLAPLVIRMRHLGLGRASSAIIVVAVSFLAIAAVTASMVVEMGGLAHKLPEYQQNVRHKLETIRSSGGGLMARVNRIIHNVSQELTPPSPSPGPAGEEKPVPVEIRRAPFSPFELVQTVLGSVFGIVVMAAVVIVFVVFILIQREDLRDRLLRLAGERRVNLTTQVLDDAARRVSRYLLAQLLLNVGFGALAGLGLYLMRVPDPFLWGMLAALLRYVPYLGIWVAAILPALVAFAVEPGWLKVPGVFALFFGIDLLMYNLAEPFLYGSSTGVSPLAILVAAVFWTWLWGPVGLLLATPLTVCVVVLGRYVPTLGFLSVMLSDDEVLTPQTRFYQRMLAMDVEEAIEVAEEFLKGKSMAELYDQVIVPALSLAEEERHRGRMDEARQKFLFQNTRLLIEDIAERADEIIAGNSGKGRAAPKTNGRKLALSETEDATVLCLPARDEADELASLMLAQLLNQSGIPARSLSVAALAGDHLQQVGRSTPKVACVSSVPPFGYMHARYLCRHLRTSFPDVRLMAAILTERDVEEIRQRQPPIPGDKLASSLKQAVAEIAPLIPSPESVHSEEAVSAST